MKALWVAILAAAVMGLAGPALADPDPVTSGDGSDTTFLVMLQSAGITYSGNEVQVISAAKQVCSLISGGKSAPDVLSALQETNPALTTDHAAKFIAIAAQSYCPNQLTTGG